MDVDKIIYDIKEAVKARSNDYDITNARILHIVDVTRAKYIRQHQQRNIGEDTVDYSQELHIELEKVDRSVLPSVPLNKMIVRSKKKLPRIIGRNVFSYAEIRSIDRTGEEIDLMDKKRAVYAIKSSIPDLVAFIDDDWYLYVAGPDTTSLFIENVIMGAILEVPMDIVSFNDMTTELTDYPISEFMWSMVKQEIIETLVKIEMNVPADVIDDNKAPL